MQTANISSDEIAAVVPHGTATISGDPSELNAMISLFGQRDIPLCTMKSHFGHMGGGSGATETALTALMVKQNIVPPCLNIEKPIKSPEGRLPNTSAELREMPIDYAMKFSIGISGFNAVLILSKDRN